MPPRPLPATRVPSDPVLSGPCRPVPCGPVRSCPAPRPPRTCAVAFRSTPASHRPVPLRPVVTVPARGRHLVQSQAAPPPPVQPRPVSHRPVEVPSPQASRTPPSPRQLLALFDPYPRQLLGHPAARANNGGGSKESARGHGRVDGVDPGAWATAGRQHRRGDLGRAGSEASSRGHALEIILCTHASAILAQPRAFER